MTTYFKTTYTAPNPKLHINFGSTTALYTGPNPPAMLPGKKVGMPIVYDKAKGTAKLHGIDRGVDKKSKPTIIELDVPMSEQTANSLGTELGYCTISGNALLTICMGGVVATQWGSSWAQGPLNLEAKAPNSQNFAKVFCDQANFFLANPFPTPNAPNADPNAPPPANGYNTVMLATAAICGIAIGGPVGAWVFGLACIGLIISTDTDEYPDNFVDVVGPQEDGGFSGTMFADGSPNFGENQDFSLENLDINDDINADMGYATGTWAENGQWGD